MKKTFLKILIVMGFLFTTACSDDATILPVQNTVNSNTASRPSVPVMVGQIQIGNQI